MSTFRKSILNDSLSYNSSGDVYPGNVANFLTLSNAKNFNCHVFEAPSGADIAIEGTFRVPNNYASTPKIIIGGYFVGAPANTFGMGFQMIARAVSESIDTAFEAEDIANESTWSGIADEDYFELTIDLTVSIEALDQVAFKLFRDDSVDTQTQRFLMTSCEFQYSDS